MRYIIPALLTIILLTAVFGCSKSGGIVSPALGNKGTKAIAASDNPHSLMAFNLFKVNPAELSIESVPVRNLTDHWNILTFLENGPCTTCIKVVDVKVDPDGTISFTVRITHPFSGLNLSGFDVRGIAMFNGSRIFPESGVSVSDSDLGDIDLVYAEGYTTLYNPTTWGGGPGGLQGYYQGKLASGVFPSATLNPFRTFKSAGTDNVRNIFYPSEYVEEVYTLVIPDSTPFIMGYAVDASWAPPDVIPVTDPSADFPISANCPEPWKLVISTPCEADAMTPNGGKERFQFTVYDYTGVNSHNIPLMECPGIFDGVKEAEFIEANDGYSSWELSVENSKGADVGKYPLVVSVEDKQNASAPDYLDLTAYNISNLWVHEPGWAIAWGNDYMDQAYDVDRDSYGNTYVTGFFYNTADLDPGEGVVEYTSMGYEDAFLSKFDPDGNLVWTRVWGADHHEAGQSMAVYADEIYICGYFNSSVDFDPGPGVTEFSSHGDWDSYISKFDTDGNFQWAQAWGAQLWDKALDISVISTGVYACGYFRGTCDFDPGPGKDEWTANPGASYVTKFDLDGNHLWVRAWSGDGGYDDLARALNADTDDGEPLIFVAGEFDGTADLDPTGGVDLHTAPGIYQDVYLCCLDDDGAYQWGVSWGNEYDEHIYGIDSVANDNRIYVTGNYYGTVDFDPGTGPGQEDIHTPVSDRDAFLSFFNASGNHKWTRSWGGGDGIGTDDDSGYRVITGFELETYVVGTFHDTVEFGPAYCTETEFTSNGEEDIFVACFDYSGDTLWARTVGGPGADYAWGAYASLEPMSRFVYVAGSFSGTVDFNPYDGKYELTSIGNTDSCLIKYRQWGHW